MFVQSSPEMSRRGGRSVAGIVSIAVHSAVGLGAIWIIQAAPAATPDVFESALTFLAATPVRAVPYEPSSAPVLPETALERPAHVVAELEAVTVPAAVESKGRDAPPSLPEPTSRQLIREVELSKPAPQLTVGAFADAPAPTRTLNPNRQVDVAGFDPASAQAVERKIADRAAVGAFDSTPGARPGTDRPAGTLVADAGFGQAAVAAARPPPAREVGEAGFGGLGGQRPSSGPSTPRDVKDSGFAAPQKVPAPPMKTEAPPERVEIPVEVLSKPSPTYTARARELKLEGEVSLEVEFCASGTIRVLRVVKGLGHGLDEAAIKAAEGIRFKPAQIRGRAVDFRTTVHITFRLT
jgi:TonB family protein